MSAPDAASRAATLLLAALLSGAVPAAAAAEPPSAVAAGDSTGAEDPEDGLPFRLGGGIYLFHYAPLDLEGVDDHTEVYAFYLDLDRTTGPWRIHVQGRWRDTRLRPFFPSSVWLQEAWAAYRLPLDGSAGGEGVGGGPTGEPAGPALRLRAGKLYQRLGRFWDGSFFGNLHYFDGLKLDPEFGVEAELRLPLGAPSLTLYGQYLLRGDRVNGALAGRDVEGIDGAEERGGIAAGARLEAPLGRVAGRPLEGRLGVSALDEGAELAGAAGGEADVRIPHVAADLALSWGEVLGYLEWTRRASATPELADLPATDGGPTAPPPFRGPSGSRATWWLAGLQAALGGVSLRYNYSTARYRDGGFREHLHQPGATLRLAEGVSALVEYTDWRRVPAPEGIAGGGTSGALPDRLRLDRSLSLVLLLEF